MKWSEEVWKEIESIFDKIVKHPFIEELGDGTLEHRKFIFYIQQDTIYLAEYRRMLAAISARLESSSDSDHFLVFAKEVIAVEGSLHQSFLTEVDGVNRIEASPTCMLYTSFLERQLFFSSVEVMVAAVLPCFWIYKVVGDFILQNHNKKDNVYQSWIETYGGEDYARSVKKAIHICDQLAESVGEDSRKKMTEAFVICSKMEWMFWDSAYRLEEWPI